MNSAAHLVLFVATLTAGLAQPATNPPPRRPQLPPGVEALRNLEYGRADSKPLLLDLYLPEKRDQPLPLIIWIHGGAWKGGSKDGGSPALHFTGEGYAVAQIEYRLSQEAIFLCILMIAKEPFAGSEPVLKIGTRTVSIGELLLAAISWRSWERAAT